MTSNTTGAISIAPVFIYTKKYLECSVALCLTAMCCHDKAAPATRRYVRQNNSVRERTVMVAGATIYQNLKGVENRENQTSSNVAGVGYHDLHWC